MQTSNQINHFISKTYIKSPGRHFKSIDTSLYQAPMIPKSVVKRDYFDQFINAYSSIYYKQRGMDIPSKQKPHSRAENIHRSSCYMQQEQNIKTEQVFNPDQKITLSNKPNIKYRKRKAKINQVNFAEKINLKNYQHVPKQQPVKKYFKKEKKSKIKLEHNEQKKQDFNTVTSQPNTVQKDKPNSSQVQQLITNQKTSQDQSQYTPSLQASSKISITPIYQKNFNNIASTNIKIQPPPLYQPVRVNPMEKIQLGPKMQKFQQNQSALLNNPKKYKIRVLNSDFTSMRYECFCSRQYLSYCATYHHLKKDHFDFLKENRRFSFTNILQTTDPVYGFRIKKITKQRLKCPKNQNKEQVEKLSKHTKQKIKAQSPQIQQLLTELKGIEEERDQQVQLLKLFQRKLHKAGELVNQYQNMIHSFQQIFNILSIRQITQKLNNGPTVFQQNDPNDQEYFPQ